MSWASAAASGPAAVVGAAFHPWTLPLSVFPGRETDQDHGGAVSRWRALAHRVSASERCRVCVEGVCAALPSPRGGLFFSLLPVLVLVMAPAQRPPDLLSAASSRTVPLHRRGRPGLPLGTGWSEGSDIGPLVSCRAILKSSTHQESPAGSPGAAPETSLQFTFSHCSVLPPSGSRSWGLSHGTCISESVSLDTQPETGGLLQFYPILDLQKTWPTEAAQLPGVAQLARDRDRVASPWTLSPGQPAAFFWLSSLHWPLLCLHLSWTQMHMPLWWGWWAGADSVLELVMNWALPALVALSVELTDWVPHGCPGSSMEGTLQDACSFLRPSGNQITGMDTDWGQGD